MTRAWARVAAGAGLVVLALSAGAPPALGDPSGSTLTVPASVPAGHSFPIQAQFVQAGGAMLHAGVPVLFSQTSAPASDCVARFDPQFTLTDATGTAAAQGTLPPGCPGTFVLVATAAGATSASVSTALTETGGFPDTTTDAPPARLHDCRQPWVSSAIDRHHCRQPWLSVPATGEGL